MPQLDDDEEGPGWFKYVNTHVTLDMLTDQELVDELVLRERLIVITAHRTVPREIFTKKDFYSAMQAILACDLSKRLVDYELIGEAMNMTKNDLEFRATIVLLSTTKEERPV